MGQQVGTSRGLVGALLRLDRWANARLLNGWGGESISSRCGKAQWRLWNGFYDRRDHLWLALGACVDTWFFWDGGRHCATHIDWSVGWSYTLVGRTAP